METICILCVLGIGAILHAIVRQDLRKAQRRIWQQRHYIRFLEKTLTEEYRNAQRISALLAQYPTLDAMLSRLLHMDKQVGKKAMQSTVTETEDQQ